MDDELKRYLADMMKQINDGNERILNRLTRIEGEVRDLRSEHSVTRDMVLKLPGAVLGAALLDRLVDALILERDDPRNRAEHPGFYAGMTRAITVVGMVLALPRSAA
jgi:hypothetical protein